MESGVRHQNNYILQLFPLHSKMCFSYVVVVVCPLKHQTLTSLTCFCATFVITEVFSHCPTEGGDVFTLPQNLRFKRTPVMQDLVTISNPIIWLRLKLTYVSSNHLDVHCSFTREPSASSGGRSRIDQGGRKSRCASSPFSKLFFTFYTGKPC